MMVDERSDPRKGDGGVAAIERDTLAKFRKPIRNIVVQRKQDVAYCNEEPAQKQIGVNGVPPLIMKTDDPHALDRDERH